MISAKKFAKNFNGLPTPDELLQLLRFENEVAGNAFYSAGFELTADDQKHGLKSYSDNERLLNSILLFANADGTGSEYGFWVPDGLRELSNAPVVVFGSEGGYHVVASDVRELLQILSYDVEPMVDWDEVSYYKSKADFEPSEASAAFHAWLADTFQLKKVGNANKIVHAAQAKYQEKFTDWMNTYYQA